MVIHTIQKHNEEITHKQQQWYLLEGNFNLEANLLKKREENKIPEKRKSIVTIAIPANNINLEGLLYAFLPTQEKRNLPFHINADFFPSSDRKRILSDNNAIGKWNESAYNESISLVAKNIDFLKSRLGHIYFWQFLEKCKLNISFWNILKPNISQSSIIWTTDGKWCKPNQAYLLTSKEQEAIPLLIQMGLSIVHSDLNTHRALLENIGVRFLSTSILINYLIASELNRSFTIEQAPQWLRSNENRNILGKQLDILLKRSESYPDFTDIKNRLAQCAIAVGSNGNFYPINQLYYRKNNDQATINLFSEINESLVFVDQNNPDSIKNIIDKYQLFKQLRADIILKSLEEIPVAILHQRLAQNKLLFRLFEWVSVSERAKVFASDGIRERFCQLPIFPSGDNLVPLTGLSVAGSFNDPLHLSSLVNLDAIGGHKEFILALGARELTLINYVCYQVPIALQKQINIQSKRKLIEVLAENLDEFKDNLNAKSALSQCLLVECQDQEFRIADDVYFESNEIQELLGNQYPIATFSQQERQKLLRIFLKWLGVNNIPKPEHLIQTINRIVQQQASDINHQKIKNIFIYINNNWDQYNIELQQKYLPLKDIAWLPAKIKRDIYDWYSPRDLFTDENSDLFFTQAKFFELPQTKTNPENFLNFLNIQREPSIDQVVEHLIDCSRKNIGLNYRVYEFLQTHLSSLENETLERLRKSSCIYIGRQRYCCPNQIFWNYSGFKPYRFSLNSNLRSYTKLFQLLNVHEYPNSEDAILILLEISHEYTQNEQILSQEDRYIINNCWDILATGFKNSEINENVIREKLQNEKVIINEKFILKKPNEMFFKDRPNLADRFPILKDNLLTKVKILNQYDVLKAAGVLSLSDIINTNLVNHDTLQTKENENILIILKNRKHLIKRVLIETKSVDKLLQNLFFKETSEIILQYSLQFNLSNEKYTESALTYSEELNNQFFIYYCCSNNKIPWPHIAREVAYLLNVDAETGQVASALKEVFSAESTAIASDILDALGFAPGTEAPPQTKIALKVDDQDVENISINIAESQNMVKTDSATTEEKKAYEIGRWAKEQANIFYQNRFGYSLTPVIKSGFSFWGSGDNLPKIEILVNAISVGRPNIRFSLLEWTTMAKNPDSYELLIISHINQSIHKIIRVKQAWITLVDVLGQLQNQQITSAIYEENTEILIGFQQNLQRNENEILFNWIRLMESIKNHPNIEFYK